MIYVNVGRRELGKTTLALYLTRNIRPRVTFDPRALCPAPHGRATNVGMINEWFNALETARESNDGADKRAELTITPETNVQESFMYTCDELKAWLQSGRSCAFIVDESTFVDLEIEPFQWIIRQAPRRSAHIVLTQHRPFDVPIRIRSIADVWCVFRTSEPNDVRVIAERCTPDFAAAVAKLRPREFMLWDDTRADNNVSVYLDPKAWYVPLATEGYEVTGGSTVDLPAANAPALNKLPLYPETS